MLVLGLAIAAVGVIGMAGQISAPLAPYQWGGIVIGGLAILIASIGDR